MGRSAGTGRRLEEGYRRYSVGTISPTERVCRLIRTVIHRSFLPGERFMPRFEIGQSFDIGTKESGLGACGPNLL